MISVTHTACRSLELQTMAQHLPMQSGALRASLRPDLGGCIEGLWFNGIPVLRSSAPGTLKQVGMSASYPLVPYSNRVARAKLVWQGTAHPLVKNFQDEEHSIHGVGWRQPWEVLQANDNFAMLCMEHEADADWPFAFDASQTFRLKNNTLELTMSVTNQSGGDAPVGLGWHPYFCKRADTRIFFSAQGLWEMGGDKLPTTLSASTGLDRACADLQIDNCFDGWAKLVDLHDTTLHVRMESDLKRLVVYTTPQKDFIAVEPVSHVNNAMNQSNATDLGVRVLRAGETWQAAMTIQINPEKAL